MKIIIILGCVLCGFSIVKNVKGIVNDVKTNKARKHLREILNGGEQNDENRQGE